MAKVLFIDGKMDEVKQQWEESGCGKDHELLPLEPFVSIERTQELIADLKPDVIVVGFDLNPPKVEGKWDGWDGNHVLCGLREKVGCDVSIIANVSDPLTIHYLVDGYAERQPAALKAALDVPIEMQKAQREFALCFRRYSSYHAREAIYELAKRTKIKPDWQGVLRPVVMRKYLDCVDMCAWTIMKEIASYTGIRPRYVGALAQACREKAEDLLRRGCYAGWDELVHETGYTIYWGGSL